MGCDMVVALGKATVNAQVIFGLNQHGPHAQWPQVRRLSGHIHAPGSIIKTHAQEVPQVRQTLTVLGCGPRGAWGFSHGINEHQVVLGIATWTSKMTSPHLGLQGIDLVRLTLERSHSACHAQAVLTDLISRFGQGDASEGRDHIFLIADPHEAVVLEAAGPYWASLDCHQVRAVSDVGMIRQDWGKLAPGLAEHAIAQGWWRDDGSKLDFSDCLGGQASSHSQGLKRWGKATVLLEQQNGHIDGWYMRQMLAEHFENTFRKPASTRAGIVPTLAATFLACLSAEPEAVAMAWCAFGSPSQAAYFPMFLDGELPSFFDEKNLVGDGFLRLPGTLEKALRKSEDLDKWQARLDQQTEDFAAEARFLKKQRSLSQLQRQATQFMARIFEGSEAELDHVSRERLNSPAEELVFFPE